MKHPVVEDWNGEDWTCFEVQWPDSDSWRRLFRALILEPLHGRMWDENTGSIEEMQTVAWEIYERNYPLTDCEECDLKDIRLVGCLLQKKTNEGEWVTVADISEECVDPRITIRLSTAFTNNGQVLGIDTDGDGNPDIFIDLASYNATYQLPQASDLDHLWAAVVKLNNYLYERCVALLDIIDAGGDVADMIANAVALGAELVGLPVDAILEWIGALEELGTDLVRADLTPENRDTLKCLLFCNMRQAVEMTLTKDRLHDWQETIENAPYGLAGSAIGLTSEAVKDQTNFKRFEMGLNDEDNDWEDLCECVGWCYEFDFEAGSLGWACDVVPDAGQSYGYYTAYEGFTEQNIGTPGAPSSGGFCWTHHNVVTHLVHVEMDVEVMSVPYGGETQYAAFRKNNGSSLPTVIFDMNSLVQGQQTVEWNGNADIEGLWLQVAISRRPQDFKITRCLLRGTGPNPFGIDNCPPLP
jgi:hypothetical protein